MCIVCALVVVLISLVSCVASAPGMEAAVLLDGGIKVTASAYENVAAGGWKDFPPEKTLDKDMAILSSWRAEAEDEHHGQWISYDLGSVRSVSQVRIAFLQGDIRVYRFRIDLSANGAIWTNVFAGESGGKTTDSESFAFDPRPARYVKITGYGNKSVSGPNKFPKWFNIVETEIWGN
jgi:hypothetical protein